MKTAFCPFPLSKIVEISISSLLAPFSWLESEDQLLPWTGEPALVFFPTPPTVPKSEGKNRTTFEPICMLEIDVSKMPYLPWYENPSGDGILILRQPIPIIPGAVRILVESETMEHEAIYLLRQSGASKYSDFTARSLVSVLTKPGQQFSIVNVSGQSNQFSLVEQRIFDRSLGVDLLLISRRSLVQSAPSWHDLRAFIVELRSKMAVRRTERSINANLPLKGSEETNAITNIEQHLMHLGALSTSNLLGDWGKAILRDNKDVCERGVEAVFDGLLKLGDSKLENVLLDAAFAWLAMSNDDGPLANFARYRRESSNLDRLVEFGKSVRRECNDQDIRSTVNMLTNHKDEDMLNWSDLLPNEWVIANIIVRTIISFRPEISATELRQRGLSSTDRSDLIKHIRCAIETQTSCVVESFWKEWESIERASRDNFMAYITGRPTFSPLMLNFVIFVMNPLDEKRLSQQQISWQCQIPLLGRTFQIALMGYSACLGETFHALWGAILKEPQLIERAYYWFEKAHHGVADYMHNVSHEMSENHLIRDNQIHAPSEEYSTDISMYGSSNEGITSNADEYSSRIVNLLSHYPNGLRKKDIISMLFIDESIFSRAIGELKITGQITYSGRGGSIKWRINK